MSNERAETGRGNSLIPSDYIDQAALDVRLPASDPMVELLAKARYELDKKKEEAVRLEQALELAQKDPLTGVWLRGPGLRRLEEMMSLVENVQAGLIKDGPNAIMAIGLDIEAMHYTNNWYGQRSGDARVVSAGQELRTIVDIVRNSSRTHDRRHVPREEDDLRIGDLIIRTGGDELMAAMAFQETDENTKEIMARRVMDRLSSRKKSEAPDTRILFRVGFFIPGQTPDDLYHSVEPKAHMGRAYKAARPLFKVVRLGMGQYRPPVSGEL